MNTRKIKTFKATCQSCSEEIEIRSNRANYNITPLCLTCAMKVEHNCLDNLAWEKVEIIEGDNYHYEKYPCKRCKVMTTWKYRFEGVFNEGGERIA